MTTHETVRIIDQYDRALNGEAWHGDSVWEILRRISWEAAFHRMAPNLHTIWELVAHMTFWETEVRYRLEKKQALQNEARNFPATPTPCEANWHMVLDELKESNRKFRGALLQLDDLSLDSPLSSPDKTVYVEVHGVIQHHLYHSGQIAILSKNPPSSKGVTGL